MLFGFVMKKLFAVVVLMMLVWHHAFSLDLNITLNNAGDLINQVDVSKLDEVESLTIAGDLNGTDILVIRKMVNLQTLDMTNANVVNGGSSYYEDYITSENEIGAYFFKDITHLTNVSLPNTVYKIGKKVFSGCEMLVSVSIGNSTEIIEESVFENCKKLGKIIIPQSVKTIGNFVFEGCTSLENVIMSDGNEILELGQYGSHYLSWRDHEGLFYDCPLKSVYLGRNVSYIEATRYGEPNSPFSDHSELETVIISESVSTLPANLFFECDAITTVKLPNSVKKIGRSVFGCCDGIISFVIPQSVSLIEGQAFWECSNLKSITIEGSPKIESDILEGCYNFETINILSLSSWLKIEFDSKSQSPYGVPYDLYLNGIIVNEVEIPADISILHECAFYDCKSIETVVVPSTVEMINENPFASSPNLKKLVIEDGENDLEWIRLTWAFTKSLEYLYLGRNLSWLGKDVIPFGGTNIKELWIGDFVNRIADKAFGCKYLENVHIGKGVNKIGREAFKGCINLKAVYISDISQWLKFQFPNITDNPLYYAKHLYLNDTLVINLTIPDDVEDIGTWCFVGCEDIETVSIPNGVLSIGNSAFRSCKKLKVATIPNSVSSIGNYSFYECDELETVVLGRGITLIGDGAFANCEKLVNITSLNTIPPAITETTFDASTEKKATLNVPIGCKNIYWLHPYWENFAKIEEIEVNEDITEKKSEAIVKYNEGIALYNNYMEFDSNVRSAYDQLENQQNYNRKIADEIEWEIYELKGKVEASDFDTELKAYFLNVLDSVDNVKYGYVKWTYEYGYDYLISELNNAKKEFESYAERLETYKSSIESATTNAELEAIIEQIGVDNSNMGAEYRSYWETDYNSLLQFIDSCDGYEAELLKLLQRLKDLKTEFDNITSGIETIASTNGNIIVYTLKGERMTMKSTHIKSLLKGIYIVNGKKFVIK